MKRTMFLALATGLALTAAVPTNAGVYIGYSLNGGPVIQLATDTATPGSAGFVGTIGSYFFNVGATGTPIVLQPGLLTQSLNVQMADAQRPALSTLTLFITNTDLNSFNGNILSSFTSNILSGSAQSVTMSSYYSAANALYGGTQLKSSTFTGLGVAESPNAINVTGPFSTTVRYDLTFGPGASSFNDTANLLATAVPEPASWSMLILGFGGIGFGLRRAHRRSEAKFDAKIKCITDGTAA